MTTKKKKNKNSIVVKFVILILLGISFATVAYANTTYDLETTANLSLGMQEGVIITNVSSYNVTDQSSFNIDRYIGTLLTNTIRLSTESSEVILEVEVKNTGNTKHRFDGILYDTSGSQEIGTYDNPNVAPEVVSASGKMNIGDTIDPSETKKILVKYKFIGEDFSGTNPGLLNGMINIKFSRLYTITYELNEGTQAEGQPNYYAEGDNISLLSPTKDRSEFVGWYKNSDFSGDAITNLSGETGDLTLYALFYTDRDIYFQMPPDWYKDDNDEDYTVKIYIYNNTTKEALSPWPGVSMTKETLSDPDITGIYKYTLSDRYLKNYDSVVFSNGKIPGGRHDTYYDVDIKKRQTIDLTLDSNNYGKIFVPELYKNVENPNEIRFFGVVNQNLHYYVWNNSTQTAKDPWPGLKLEDKVGDTGLKFMFDKVEYDKLIINKGLNAEQSHDLPIPSVADLTFSSSKVNSDHYYFYVVRWFYGGSWYSIYDWEDSKYYLWKIGDYASFQNTANAMTETNTLING